MQRLRPCRATLLAFLMLLSAPVIGQVTANFTSTPNSGCSPLVVQFADNSSGSVTSWFWDFGNGNTSTLQNPAAVYINPGQYTVSLTVSDGSNTDTRTVSNLITVFQNPNSNFSTTTPTAGCAPLTVNFQDLSTPGDGNIVSWLWDFGDGTNSTQQNPTHTFSASGSYTITLVVTDDNGCSNTFLISNYINVSTPPTTAFTGGPLSACDPPLTVNFTNNSSGGAVPLSYQWDFGDGNSSTAPNPSHTYTNYGSYNVTLITTDANGCADTLVRNTYININIPTAAFTAAPTTICEGQVVSFTNNSTGAANYQWDFGDGNTATQQNPNHTYTTSGTYTVTLIATTGAGCADTIVQPGLITVEPAPVANFTSDTTAGCEAPLAVNFSDLSTGAVSWAWDFGDGNTSISQNPTHTYNTPGTYTVSLTITSANGCTDQITFNNYISIVEPTANFQAIPPTGCAPLIVNFTDFSTSPNDPITTWVWDFGDGNTSNLQNPTHTYTTPGVYNATLTITTAGGCTDNFTFPIQVGTPPVACFSGTPQTVCVNDPVNFTDCSTNATTWFWEFGDGNTSTQQNPTHTYQDTGCFTVRLTVTNFGCADDTVIVDYICVSPPIAQFNLNPVVGCAIPHTVFFTDQSVLPDTWFWDFGDGNTSTAQNPVHTYTAFGNYTVTLTVTDTITGCSDDATANVSISNPTADFTGSPLFGCGPLTVNFTDASTTTPGFAITGWAWDFGDGNTSTQQNPTHTYQAPGVYTVTLTVTDANGCAHTRTRTNYVQVIGPNVNFGADTTDGCNPLTVNFTDSTIFGAPITSWAWDFGDGNSSNLQNPIHTYTNTGTYTVSLTVTDVNGCSRTFTRNNYIRVTYPQASFTYSDTLACTGYSIAFNNTSVGVGLSHQWDFGDGNTSTQTNPSHIYTSTGTYTVQLITTDVNGCTDTATITNAIEIRDVQANFSASNTSASCPPLVVTFSDSSMYDIVSWEWDFGDGTGSTLQNPSHVYATAGSFDVRLIVSNSQGCVDTLLLPGLINIQGPNGSFTQQPDSGCTPFDVLFNATATNTVSYTWDFGDGNVVITTVDSVIHTYSQTGTFNPVLILDDGLGCTFTVDPPDTIVVDTIPIVNFTANSNLICGVDSVRFTDLTVSTRPITSWIWYFGDGAIDSIQNPVHLYPAPGSYTVSLVVENSLGCRDSIALPAFVDIGFPPSAAFTPSDTIGCRPLAVSYTDNSVQGTSSITSWQWAFGNGTSSTLQNPTNLFGNAGVFPVQLIVEDAIGCRDTAVRNIQVNPGPSATLSTATPLGCPPFTVTFNGATGQGIVSWEWDFGDGNTALGAPPITHTYQNPGDYTVQLIVTDTLGCTDTIARIDYIGIHPPAANFTQNITSGCPGTAITFTDASTADTTLVNWYWDFGDGDTAIGNPVTHVYDSSGTFNVTLIIEDLIGCRDTLVQTATVNILFPPNSQFGPVDTIGCNPFTISFRDSTSAGSAAPVSWAWDFGDGNTSTQQNPIHTFLNPGLYTVELIVTDANGCQDTITHTVQSNPGPTAGFISNDTLGCPPHSATFIASTGQGIVSWAWDFGDGNTGTGNPVTNIYQAAGNYTVRLIVEDTLGCRDTIIRPNYIRLNPPLANFSQNITSGCPGTAITFTDNSTYDTTTTNILWDFGDGNTGSGSPITHVYDSSGQFTVTLIVEDILGCRDTVSQPNLITIFAPPAVQFGPIDTIGCNPFTVTFRDSTSAGSAAPVSWAWDFGDGNTSTLQNPIHTFLNPGLYTVELIVTDANGCQDTITHTAQSNPGPTAGFTSNDTLGCPPHSATFMASTGQGIVSWAWDFGDGNTGTGNPVTNIYQTAGNYTVTLIVEDTLGCRDTIIRPNYIRLNPPIASFSQNITSGCPGTAITFTDNSTYDTTTTNILWDFGDGNTGSGSPITHVYDSSGQFTVTLIVEDILGCRDTISQPNLITIFEPPLANFGIIDTVACTPFTIELSDSSTSVFSITNWNWDFGDGNSSTLQNPIHPYTTPGNYTIELIVTDINGCQDTASLPFTAPVRPTAQFSLSDSVACDILPVTFTAGSADIVSWYWDFGDGSDTLGGPVVSHTYNDYGRYFVTLIIEDIYGCQDTFTRPDFLLVDSLDAGLSASTAVGCAPFPVSFTDQSYSDTTISSWFWQFGDGNTSTQQNPTHTYTTAGNYTVILTVTNAIGCVDSDTIDLIEIFDPLPPIASPIYVATVLNNTTDSIAWQSYTAPDFSHYVLYRENPTGSGNYIPIDSFFNRTDTTFIDGGLNTLLTNHCYKLQVVDVCGLRTPLNSSPEHCTINLTATPSVDANLLDWTAYVGWQVDEYDIYRVQDYNTGTAQLIGTVNGNTTLFIDSNVRCNERYCYRVSARELGGFAQISWSDTSCASPDHTPNQLAMTICRATVEDNSEVLVEWEAPLISNPELLILERSTDNNTWTTIATLPFTSLSYLDTAVNVNEQSYYYRVAVLDSCGDLSPFSNIGRTILLDAELDGGAFTIGWNPYEEWAGGIQFYDLEIQNDATGSWEFVDRIPGNMTLYVDETSNLDQPVFCYRVFAQQAGGSCLSLSNIDCVPVGPVLFAGNAFSPNGDGINEFFELKGYFIREYNIKIYDRWGALIFESNDLNTHWDGTWRNKPCQEGAYVFVAIATGFDGQDYEIRGSVTLIR